MPSFPLNTVDNREKLPLNKLLGFNSIKKSWSLLHNIMAIIECPKCTNKISDSYTECPHCNGNAVKKDSSRELHRK